MPVEFALRPRIHLREDPAPARRARPRLPKFALPALGYWLVMGGLVYEYVRHHDANAPTLEAEAALAPVAPASPPAVRPWWRPLPAPVAPARTAPTAEPSAPEPALVEAEPTEPALTEPALVEPPPPDAPNAEPPLARRSPEPAHARRLNAREPNAPAAAPHVSPPMPVPAPSLASRDLLPSQRGTANESMNAPALAPALPPSAASSLPSCEAALASASQDVDFSGGNRTADLPAQAIAAVLENGAWLSSCAVPDQTALDVCVAIKAGRVVGASVSSRPADAALNNCVKRRASSLQFPFSPHLDLARTRF